MPVAKETGGNFTPLPAGSHIARCIAVVSLGTQPSDLYPAAYKVLITWEVPDEPVLINNERVPMTISKEYTLSLGKKANLRKDLEGWRGREFTAAELQGVAVEKVLDQVCMLSVVHKQSSKGSTYAAITSISRPPKGIQCGARYHELVHYEIEQGKDDTYRKLPEFIRKKIDQCEEIAHPPIDTDDSTGQPQAVEGQAPSQIYNPPEPEEDDVPF